MIIKKTTLDLFSEIIESNNEEKLNNFLKNFNNLLLDHIFDDYFETKTNIDFFLNMDIRGKKEEILNFIKSIILNKTIKKFNIVPMSVLKELNMPYKKFVTNKKFIKKINGEFLIINMKNIKKSLDKKLTFKLDNLIFLMKKEKIIEKAKQIYQENNKINNWINSFGFKYINRLSELSKSFDELKIENKEIKKVLNNESDIADENIICFILKYYDLFGIKLNSRDFGLLLIIKKLCNFVNLSNYSISEDEKINLEIFDTNFFIEN